MKDSQLLSMLQESALQDLPDGQPAAPPRQGVLVFDAFVAPPLAPAAKPLK